MKISKKSRFKYLVVFFLVGNNESLLMVVGLDYMLKTDWNLKSKKN